MTRFGRLILVGVLCALARAPRAGIAAPPAAAADTPLLTPPGTPPVRVETGFYLLNLASVNERTESFEADIYLRFTWHDPRLAFSPSGKGDGRRTFVETAAEDALKEIWWPEIEFVNAAIPQVRNRSLVIKPDGTVTYYLGVTSQFRSRCDYGRFPLDRQVLEVKLQSFLYNDAEVRFVVDPGMNGFAGGDTCDDLRVTGLQAVSRTVRLIGQGKSYSEFDALISVRRNYAFYVWRVFFPTILIMAMSFTVYFIRIPDLHDRVAVSLSCLLACIATQFAISFNMPKIAYLTIVDKVYLVTYGCIALGVGVSVLENALHNRSHPRLNRCNRIARWAVPALYVLMIFWIAMPHPW
jgi:hypothetical protein